MNLDAALAERLAAIAAAALEREYPNHLTHLLHDDEDARSPRVLHPAFYGALDWHSAVHNHWLLARLLRRFPDAGFAAPVRALIERHLNRDTIARECEYFAAPGREGFERPYGWAWLLALDAELAPRPPLREALAPLVGLISRRIPPWLAALPYPVRSGEHANTAFALGLMLEWSRETGNAGLEKTLADAAERFYRADRNASLAFEPSGQDFLSPLLAEAALMACVLEPVEFAAWLADFLPAIPVTGDASWFVPAIAPESADYKLAHLAGLNLSRAWMLSAICAHLPARDRRRATLHAVMTAHAEAGLNTALREDYGASHWLPTFAVYLFGR